MVKRCERCGNTTEYNGWKNWETWNTMLWIGEMVIDEDIKEWWGEGFKEGYYETEKPKPQDLEDHIKESFHEFNGGLVEKGLSIDNHHIDWKEITDSILEDWEVK